MEQQSETFTVETLSARLDGIAGSLATDVESVATGTSEILDAIPGQPQALFLLIAALKLMGVETGAYELLQSMAQDHANIASVHYDLGLLAGRLGMTKEAIGYLSRAVELEPNHPAAWRALGDRLAQTDDRSGASRAYARHTMLSLRELKLVEDTICGGADDLARAESILGQALAINPTDVVAMWMLGEIFLALGRLKEAEATLRRAVQLAPGCAQTRSLYATTLIQQMNWEAANAHLEILLRDDPGNPQLGALMAANLIMLGERDESLRLFEKLRPGGTSDRVFWMNYGNAARYVGKDDETIVEAYRKCIGLDPGYGTAWWGLADLKTYRFTPAEIATMHEQLGRNDISDGQRCHLEFALGKALEDAGEHAESFEHYSRGNALRRLYISYSADTVHTEMTLLKAFYTSEFFSARRGSGCPSAAPIFIVGMARAGSTLVEQILASHSQVEGTMELPDLADMVSELIRQYRPEKAFPGLLSDFDAAALAKLGEAYLARTRHQRRLGRPFFTDKAGFNLHHIGLIRVILPNAKIIDVRRHPLACGFSCYKQAFAPGALHLAYDQTDIGRYCRDYVELMAHYDDVIPGHVHRLYYEDLVRDPEREIRRLLVYCDLPFEEQCLRSHETDRTVRTSSSQQVRQPIRKRKIEAWEHYDAWLQPMKDALGDVLTRYPDVPEFL